jgi:2'-5' RNA ligase
MPIISCYDGFNLSQIVIEDYIKIINESLQNCLKFKIEFKGLTASPSCIMVQGFPNNNLLNQFRNKLRENFKSTTLQQSIDERYSIQTAHSTIFRLRERLNNKREFLNLIDSYRNHYFGSFVVENVELVYNDWYQRKENVKELLRFEI